MLMRGGRERGDRSSSNAPLGGTLLELVLSHNLPHSIYATLYARRVTTKPI